MEIWQAIILGIVQGLTEFLPISSSGHLVLAPRIFGWEEGGLTFDVGLHLGTTLAVLAYFWRDWLGLLRAALAWRSTTELSAPEAGYRRMLPLLLLALVPAAVAGLLLDSFIEDNLRSTALITAMIGIFALVMWAAEWVGRQQRGLDRLLTSDAVAMGAAQALALIPGVSRSGVTISSGLFTGLTIAAAARFSFLIGTPAVLGAGLLQAIDLARGEESLDAGVMLAGFVTSAIVGFITIHVLLRFLTRFGLMPFVVYRLLLCLALTVWMLS